MDDLLLLDATERYLKGEMSAEEKVLFEQLRQTKPEVDQLVVEHSFFLQELELIKERWGISIAALFPQKTQAPAP